ncbi:MAG: AAA family ATPase [Limisphaerales bacterium]
MTTDIHIAQLAVPTPRLPPHSVEIEAQVLGCLITSPGLAPQIERLGITRLSFYDLRHQRIFNAVQALVKDGKGPDTLTVVERLKAEGMVEDAGGWGYLASLEGSALMFEQYVAELHQLRARRELLKQTASIESRAHDLLEPIATLQSDLQQAVALSDTGRNALPDINDMAAFLKREIPEPPQLIYGLLHQGSKMVLGGGSKTYKTWTLTDLAISVACGEPWLSLKTTKAKVLYANFEMFEFSFQKRARAICQSKNITIPEGAIDVWNLRSYVASYTVLFPRILERIKKSNYSMIVLDPIYKTYGETDENAAGAVAMLMNGLEQLSAQTGAAVVFGAHYAKGNAASKEAIDRISGSGVFARDPDTIVNVTRHEIDEAFTIEATLRNFKPIEPFVVRWIYPLMRRDEDLDPSRLKQANSRKKQCDPLDLLAVIESSTRNAPVSVSQWATNAKVKRSTLYEYLPVMVKKGWVDVVGEGKLARRFITTAGLDALNKTNDLPEPSPYVGN